MAGSVRTRWGSFSAPQSQDPLAAIRGPTSKRRENGGEGKEGRRPREREKGKAPNETFWLYHTTEVCLFYLYRKKINLIASDDGMKIG